MDDYSRRAFLRTSLPGFLGIGMALPAITAMTTRAMAHEGRLPEGSISTLTSKERNIHRLKARELTQLIDIFAPPYTRERVKTSRWFEVDKQPWKGSGNDYLAKIRSHD